MTTQEAVSGLLANIPRIEARQTLQAAQAYALGRSGRIDIGLLRTAGFTQREIGRLEMEQHKAEALAAAKEKR